MRSCSRSLARACAIAAIVVAAHTAVGAHDFWLEPSTYEPRVGEPVSIFLKVGEHFVGEPVARNSSRIERFVLVGPPGERQVAGRDGMNPAGLLRVDVPGIWYAAYRSRPNSVTLAPEAFEQYLREEGLERIIDERASRKEAQRPGREEFSRSVKALLRTATTPLEGYDRAVGLTLELIPQADPVAAASELPLLLLHNGSPLPGALVVAYRRDPNSKGKGTEAARLRTDENGRVRLPVGAGEWLVKAVHMERTDSAKADWQSVWTALTFRVPS